MIRAISYRLSVLRLKLFQIFLISFFILTAYSLQLTASHADTVSSRELIENAKSLDGETVTYKGEAVAAILNRGEYSWANLNDGDNAIGVWCKSAQLKDVKFLGGYKNVGDLLEVEGIFHRACPLHAGELDIHANTIRFVKSGMKVSGQFERKRLELSLALFLITLAVIIVFRKRL